MSRFTGLDLPVRPERPRPSDAQTRELLKAARRGYSYAQRSGASAWSGAIDLHENKLVAAIQEMWPTLAKDQGVALVPQLPPVPAGERYHREFETRWSHVLFDMSSEQLTVSVHGGGLAAAEEALLVALAMVRAGAALGPEPGRRSRGGAGRVALPDDPGGLSVSQA